MHSIDNFESTKNIYQIQTIYLKLYTTKSLPNLLV